MPLHPSVPVLKNPFKDIGIREPPPEQDVTRMLMLEDTSGQGKPPTAVPRPFVTRHRASASIGTGLPEFKRPAWVAKLTQANAPPAQVLDALDLRVAKAPSEAALREAQIILNDIGRLQDGGKLVRGRLTQQMVDKLIGKEG
jgi:hypothetical protein